MFAYADGGCKCADEVAVLKGIAKKIKDHTRTDG